MALDLVTYLDKNLFETFFICLYPSNGGLYEKLALERNIPIIYLNKKPGFDLNTFKDLRNKLSELKPDIIHTHLQASIYTVPWVIFNKRTRWIHTIHNEASKELPTIHSRIMKFFYKKNIAVPIAISEIIRKSISAFYGMSEKDIPLIHNGIDTEMFTPEQSESKERITFCCVARFSYQKNHKLLLEAFHIAHKNIPNVSLLLVGDGELRSEIENQINSYGITDRVQMIGNTNDVLSWLRSSDVFVLSSNYEGLPLSILEAMSAGLPIIATEVGGIPDIITNGQEGILISPGNAGEIANAMEEMAKDTQLRIQMKSNARTKAQKFDVRRMADLYGVIYRNKMGG